MLTQLVGFLFRYDHLLSATFGVGGPETTNYVDCEMNSYLH